MKTPFGVWIDDSPKTVLTPRYFDRLVELNMQTIAIMIDSAERGFDPTWTMQQLETARRLAEPRNIRIAITTWPEPVKRTIDKMVRLLPDILDISGAEELEGDHEFNWRPARVDGFKNALGRSALDLAGDYFVEMMRSVISGVLVRLRSRREVRSIELALTTFTAHTENGRSADVAPHCDILYAQAYSVRNRVGVGPIDWDHSYGPGRMQRLTLDRTLLVPGTPKKPRVAVGLAAWDQRWPRHTVHEAILCAVQASLFYRPAEIRWWSSKWILGSQAGRNRDVVRAIEELARAA